jgi:hypothetical protein
MAQLVEQETQAAFGIGGGGHERGEN